jgi:hypothetical protein
VEHFAIVYFGDPESTVRARFPGSTVGTREDCENALARWRQRAGHLAGTAEAAHSIRVAGPYSTRARARRADISEQPS